jgi:hypothetical protein
MLAMPPPRNRERQVLTAICIVALLGLAWMGWQALGGLGVGILGLLVLFVAVRVELEGNGPVGAQSNPEFYATQVRAEREQPHTDRVSRRAENVAFLSSARVGVAAGAVLTVVGFGLLFSGVTPSGSIDLFELGDIFVSLFLKGRPW